MELQDPIILKIISLLGQVTVKELHRACKEKQSKSTDKFPCNKRNLYSALNRLHNIGLISSHLQNKKSPERSVSITEKGLEYLYEISLNDNNI